MGTYFTTFNKFLTDKKFLLVTEKKISIRTRKAQIALCFTKVFALFIPIYSFLSFEA